MKVSYVISDIEHSHAFLDIFEHLRSKGVDLQVVLLNPRETEVERILKSHGFCVERVNCTGKWHLVAGWWRVLGLLHRFGPDSVHCHLAIAQLVGLTTAWVLRIKKRIYTRHHTTFYIHEIPKLRFLDYLSNACATHIGSTCQNVTDCMVKYDGVDPKNIHLLLPGIHLEEFSNVSDERLMDVRKRHGLDAGSPAFLVISRLVPYKCVDNIFNAFESLIKSYPSAKLLLANGKGPLREHFEKRARELPAGSIRFLPFEPDLPALMKAVTAFIHVPESPESEAFGQVYIEAWAAGVPCILTASGVARELAQHSENAWVVPFGDSQAIGFAMKKLIEEPGLREKFSVQGPASVRNYSIQQHLDSLYRLYSLPSH